MEGFWKSWVEDLGGGKKKKKERKGESSFGERQKERVRCVCAGGGGGGVYLGPFKRKSTKMGLRRPIKGFGPSIIHQNGLRVLRQVSLSRP